MAKPTYCECCGVGRAKVRATVCGLPMRICQSCDDPRGDKTDARGRAKHREGV